MTEIAAEEGETRSLLHIVLIAAALIILGGGFIYLIYSTVEDIVAVREGRASRSYGSEQSTKNLAQSNTVILPVETGVPTYSPISAKPNGTVIWKIRVAPRTPLVRFKIDASKTKRPTRVRFLAPSGSSAQRHVATIWAGPAASTEISLPMGRYRVGLSTPEGPTYRNPNTTDAFFMPDIVELAYPGSPIDPATLTLARGRKPEITGKLGAKPSAKNKPAKNQEPAESEDAIPTPPDNYEGLGGDASDGGTPTYG